MNKEEAVEVLRQEEWVYLLMADTQHAAQTRKPTVNSIASILEALGTAGVVIECVHHVENSHVSVQGLHPCVVLRRLLGHHKDNNRDAFEGFYIYYRPDEGFPSQC